MTKKYFCLVFIFLGILVASQAFAVAPQISNVKFKNAGDSAKIAVFFDQPVFTTASGTGAVLATDFVLAGTKGTTATTSSVEHSASPASSIVILTADINVNATSTGQWTVAAASNQIFNAQGEAATTTAVDLNGKGDSAAPTVKGVFLHSNSALDVMFSEEVDSTTSVATTSYSSLLTTATDTPGILSRTLVSEKTFAIVGVTASTTLNWGVGNTVDVNLVQDLVGNVMSGTTTATILPALKVSEAKAESSTNTQDEFIELYNVGDLAVDITNLFLHIRTGGTDTDKTLTRLKSSIPSKGYYLIGSNSSYSGSVSLDASYDSSANDLTANSGVYISASSSADTFVIDLLGMGTSPIKETATTSALTAGQSFERKAQTGSTQSSMAAGGGDEFKGNSFDADNNSTDFIARTTPQPQNSLSPTEFPFGGPGASDATQPQVTGSFPSGNAGEVVANNLSYVGFGFNEPVQENTVSTSTVKLFKGADLVTNHCQSITYLNFPAPGDPAGKCTIATGSLPLDSVSTYTFKILGDNTNSATSTAVRDFASNTLNQPGGNKGDASGNYVITFTPSSGGGGFSFQAPPAFVVGTLPFPGAFNIPTDIKKATVKFSADVKTNTVNTTNIQLLKVSDNSTVSITATTTTSEPKFASDVVIITVNTTLAANTQYRINVSGVQDTNSQVIPTYSATFTTGAGIDATGPKVVGKLPSASTGVPVNAIDIHVMTDDKLDPTTVSASSVTLKQGSNTIPGAVSFDPFTGEVILLANNVFLASTEYKVSLNASSTSPCIKNISGLCLQDDDGTANNLYEFTFTTGSADGQAPKVVFANADQFHLSVTFDEPLIKSEAETFANYALTVNGTGSTLSALTGQKVAYDAARRTVVFDNVNLPAGATFVITVTGVHDLAGNLIGETNNIQGTVQNVSTTSGFVGPGGPSTSGGGAMPPTNFATSTFSFVPQVEVRPFSPLVGATTGYGVGLPISKQIKSSSGSGKIVLTFPTGFDVTSAALETLGPSANDLNGPGPGTVAVTALTADATARTITITLTVNTRCDSGNSAPCNGDAHDFLHFDLKNIVNSSIPKDAASGGYTIDVKTFDGTTVLESLTSRSFYLIAGGTDSLVVSLTASGASSGTTTVRLFSPLTGQREAVSTAFSSGSATSTFTGLLDGDYAVFTDPIITLGGTDYIGRLMPTPVRLAAGTTTMAITLQSTASLTSVTVQLTAPTGKSVDIFANAGDKFVVKATTTTGSLQTATLKLSDGTWFVGVGPSMPRIAFSGPPPAPDFVMQPPVQVIVSGSSVKESSGTFDDGILVFTLSSAGLTLSGTVVDSQGKTIVGAEVFAFSPLGGFGTHGSTDGLGKFNLKVAAGTYQVGVAAKGLPPSGEQAVEVKSDGSLVVNGQTTAAFVIKLIKPERSISGKILDQNNNPVQGSGVFAYCDPAVTSNSCFGPGDHSFAPTNSDGSYTLYVKSGTWKVGAFLPGYGELPQVQKVVSSADLSDVNFSPSTSTTFRTISGTVCRDTDASGNATTCGSGDQKISGAFIRAEGTAGANQTVTGTSGAYTVQVPSGSGYSLLALDPSLGRLKSLTSVDASSGNVIGQDFVVGNPRTITVNVKDSGGSFVQVQQLFVDFFDFTNQVGNTLAIKNATSASISLPDGSYRVRASFPGQTLGASAIASDVATTTVSVNAVLTVDGNETIKITPPDLGTVSGTVYVGTATAGNELAEAFVSLASPSSGVFIGTQANASGTYSIKLPTGTYTTLAQKPGYLATPVILTVTSTTSTTTLNLVVNQTSLAISGTVTVESSAATKSFVRAERLGGGFSGATVDSSGVFSLPVASGTWRVYAMSPGYQEVEATASPFQITDASVSGVTINLATKVTLTAPKVCQITPAQGGECTSDIDSDGNVDIRVTVPPGAFGTDSTPATLSIKENNARQKTSVTKPVGTGFDFEASNSSGNTITTFSSSVTLEFTQSKSTLTATGITTKTLADGVKIVLWSETIKDYETLTTTVEYLDASNAVVTSPASDLSNVTRIRFKALATHF